MPHSAGERLFARYASSPNLLGYCGPDTANRLSAVARGEDTTLDVRQVARQFSGAWAYQCVLAEMLGADAMDEQVVRAYWMDAEPAVGLDRAEFWRRLRAVIGPQTSAYWHHLTDELAGEAVPSHSFHVLGVYPWSRLLATGRPEPVHVLDSCCIRVGEVRAVAAGGVTVDSDTLTYQEGQLGWQRVTTDAVAAPFDRDIAPGDRVALHWGSICDVLTAADAARIDAQLHEQVHRTNARLAREQR